MTHDLIYEKLLTRLSGKALLIDHNYLSAANYRDLKKKSETLKIKEGTAWISVQGILFQHYDWILERFLQNVSFYDTIKAQFQAAQTEKVISPKGENEIPKTKLRGEACGCFDLVAHWDTKTDSRDTIAAWLRRCAWPAALK